MNTTTANEILTALHKMQPVSADKLKLPFEQMGDRFLRVMTLTSGVIFIVLLPMVGWNIFIAPLADWLKLTVRFSAMLCMFFSIIGFLANAATGIWSIMRYKTNSLRALLLESEHDSTHTTSLASYKKEDLEGVRDILKLKITRVRDRIGFFFGGSDKIALFSLAGFGWATIKELSTKDLTKFPMQEVMSRSWPDLLFIGFAAFLSGLALGSLLINYHLQHYVYQLQILELAIQRMARKESEASSSAA